MNVRKRYDTQKRTDLVSNLIANRVRLLINRALIKVNILN